MKKVIIHSEASNRILDFGGWSDTHFAGSGTVLNFAVTLCANVTLITRAKPGVVINVIDYGERIEAADIEELVYNNHLDLLKAALKVMQIRQGLEVHIWADVPPGCGTGSSAAISVALINALSLLNGTPLAPHEIARMAHSLETKELGLECGIQDQIAAANGGINYIEMYEYPNARVSRLAVAEDVIHQLNAQLLLVYEGAAHLSSEVHQRVIENLSDPKSRPARALEALKTIAIEAKNALLNADFKTFARLINRNHELQTELHPRISTPRIEEIKRIAFRAGANGLKINGAGGGGSATLLCQPARKQIVARALKDAGYSVLPCRINPSPATAWFLRA
ncbi:MAG: GHMP kinase [Candidatus Sumerlaeota bacterium]|nr:GHMP kinase [Candidatus Sumerlaeota bacterium]